MTVAFAYRIRQRMWTLPSGRMLSPGASGGTTAVSPPTVAARRAVGASATRVTTPP